MGLLNNAMLSSAARHIRSQLKRRLRDCLLPPDVVRGSRRLGSRVIGVVMPETQEQVAETVRICSAGEVLVLPSSSPQNLPDLPLPERPRPIVVVCTRALLRPQVDVGSMPTVSVPAGLTIGELEALAGARGWQLPVDLPAPQSATIGSVVATDRIGPRSLKYGAVRDYVQDCSIVLADGSVVSSSGGLIDEFGYTLNKLVIGSRGCLGIITRVSLKLVPLPGDFRMAMIFLQDSAQAQDTMSALRRGRVAPSVVELVNAPAAREFGHELSAGQMLMLAGFEDEPEVVEGELSRLSLLFGDEVILIDHEDSLDELHEIVTWSEQPFASRFDVHLGAAGGADLLDYCGRRNIAAIAHAGTGEVIGLGETEMGREVTRALIDLAGPEASATFRGRVSGVNGDRPDARKEEDDSLAQAKKRIDPLGIFPPPQPSPRRSVKPMLGRPGR